MTREEALSKANDYYSSLRADAANTLSWHEREIREKHPEIADMLNRRAGLPLECMRLAISGKSDPKQIAEHMKSEGLSLNAAIRKALCDNGYASDYLNTHYVCTVCKDTGYIADSMPAKMCSCFVKKLNELMNEDDGNTSFSTQNFESFDESRIPEFELKPGLTQRRFTVAVKEALEEYADSYPSNYKNNILLSGPAGVGKTFLLNCVGQRIAKKGENVVMISACKLLEAMRAKHFHTDDANCEFDRLLTCPVLIIDDLGSEPVLRNITREYLGMLINERMLQNLHTLISCNLSRTQILEVYDERIMSRLCDKSSWDFIKLDGKDLRRTNGD